MCDNNLFTQSVEELFTRATLHDENGNSVIKLIATRYLWNILNGRFAWRNRFSSSEQTVVLDVGTHEANKLITVNPLAYDLDAPPSDISELTSGLVVKSETNVQDMIEVRNLIAEAFINRDSPITVKFSWTGVVGEGATVYPSQAYVENGPKMKVLLNVGSGDMIKDPGDAIISDQKIGAALRYFDDWHGQGAVVPVNPYAGDKMSGNVYRDKGSAKKINKVQNPSLYDLLLSEEFMGSDDEIQYDEKLKSGQGDRNLAFVISCFIRGGLYQTKGSAEGGAGTQSDEVKGDEDE